MDVYMDFIAEQWILFAAFALILGLLIRSVVTPMISGVKGMVVNEAVRLIDSEDSLVLDVRLDREFETGYINGAINIPVGALEARISELDKYKNKRVLVVCQTGGRSMSGARTLRKHGFEEVYNLNGGVNAWVNGNMPITTKSANKKKKKNK
jgi:rhodanese-related sulfurtransferase